MLAYLGFRMERGVPTSSPQRGTYTRPLDRVREEPGRPGGLVSAIFFDRDRTLIHEAPAGLPARAAHAPEHLRFLEGAVEALELARAAGHAIVVVTNQAGAAKGLHSRAAIDATNAAFMAMCAANGVPLDALYACLHHETGAPGGDSELIVSCDCRKPKPGMLLRAARELGLDLARSALIGDADTDMEAARAAGVREYRVGDRGQSILAATRAAVADLAGAVPGEMLSTSEG
jgi:D-glycero-D-manno-heptose 1,7-bisphosphate phosphatase